MRPKETSLVIVLLLLPFVMAQAQSSPKAITEIHFRGTPPPIPSIYACRTQLDGKPYAREAAQNCLDQIMASGYFLSGKIAEERLPSGRIHITLDLDAPSLSVAALDLNLSQMEERNIMQWLEKDPRTLRLGSTFDNASLGLTKNGITQYYESQGQNVGVSSIVRLDYKNKSASVAILITKGPLVHPEVLLPPYAAECEDPITKLNWLDIDDLVLSPLAHRLSEIRPFSCYDTRSLKIDEDRLKKTEAFQSVTYTTVGAKGDREVSLSLRGKPIKVKNISFQCYGNVSGCNHPTVDLPLRAGSIYSRSAAHQAASALGNIFSKPGQRVEVLEDADLNSDGTATIVFRILSYDEDQVFVDGQRISRDSG